jgi:hypothetical protein
MKVLTSLAVVPAVLLAGSLVAYATPPQARIVLVERNTAPGAQPSILHKQVPGQPDHEAYLFSQPVHVGSPVTETVRIAFNDSTTLRGIEASNDFHVAGSSCRIGQTYPAGESCDVSVTLDPHGPGKRAGQLTFTSSESATPDVVGLQGQTLGAVISFIPAQINTMPQSLPGGVPLLSAPFDIVTDQGDNLYMSDWFIGSNSSNGGIVYFMDGSNQMTTLIGGGNTAPPAAGARIPNASVKLGQPGGIAVDSFLDLFTPDNSTGALYETTRGSTYAFAGLGSTPAEGCTPSAPCTPSQTQFLSPSWINIDNNQNLFVTDDFGYYEIPWGGKVSEFPAAQTSSLIHGFSFGLDSSDNLYALDKAAYNFPGDCAIDGVSPTSGFAWDAAGSGICGFAGNNIRSQGAEISSGIQGYAFDAAGDMYFNDSINGVIRRVDSYNGLIRTAAGNASLPSGDSGDGGPATMAQFDDPVGVAVDSYGNIYTTTVDPAFQNGPSYVVRKVGPVGEQNFPVTLVGQISPVETVLITNTGNDNLQVSNVILGGADPADFVADPATSSCVWSQPLVSGRSCQIGYTCRPKAAGARTATLTFVDNTATFQNQVILNCYALAAKVTDTIQVTSPTAGAQYIAGSNVPLQVTVSNNITTPDTPPTGTVGITVAGPTPGSFTSLPLAPQQGATKSLTAVQQLVSPKVGAYTTAATYSGDALDNSGASPTIAFTVVQVTPTVTIAVPANNSQALPGAQTATVTVSNAGITPTAPSPTGSLTLTLTNTATSLKTTFNATMPAGNNGQTTTNIPLGSLALGQYTLVAAYSGDTADKAASSSTTAFSVVQLAPVVTITSPNPSSYPYLTALTYSASVSNAGLTPADPSAPTGTVTFTVTNLTTSAVTTYGPYALGAGSAGVVNVSVPNAVTPTVASYSISAAYSGDTDDAAATSNTSLFNVNPVTPVIVWPAPSFVFTGTKLSSTQLDAVAKYNGAVVPGTYVYNPPSGTLENSPGQVTLGVTFFPTDSTDYNQAKGSVQLTVIQQTTQKPTSTRLASAANPSKSGDPIPLNVEVNPASGTAAPTGTVTIIENGKTLGVASLTGGKATVKLQNLSAGTHTLVARYSGNAQNKASDSEPVSQVVSPNPAM